MEEMSVRENFIQQETQRLKSEGVWLVQSESISIEKECDQLRAGHLFEFNLNFENPTKELRGKVVRVELLDKHMKVEEIKKQLAQFTRIPEEKLELKFGQFRLLQPYNDLVDHLNFQGTGDERLTLIRKV